MPNQQIFCNTPWYELHIYWDGGFGICCQESHRLYQDSSQYNIANMSIMQWFNSEPVRKFRTDILGATKLSECRRCYVEEQHGGNSRRLKSNLKSVIFTRQAFDQSFKQSPGYPVFSTNDKTQGTTTTYPIDLHIDLGNYCNLACKMCSAQASSTIASQEVKWGIDNSKQYLGTDWTKDPKVWQSFKDQLLQIPDLKNIHFMGGETLLTNRFEDLVDWLIDHGRFEICFSFVTNGTVFRPDLIEKLKRFQRVGIEISIESIDEHNAYQRQGTDTSVVLNHIKQYQTHCNNTSITVALRPAPSALTIGYYVGLLQFALDNQLVVKSNLCYEPRFLSAEILPTKTKLLYQTFYQDFLKQLDQVDAGIDYNSSDPNNYQLIIKEQAEMCLAVLQTPEPLDYTSESKKLVQHCKKWDEIYGYNARVLYPELIEILDLYDY
jgi:pyruvate-formate lyase-activating enzyme